MAIQRSGVFRKTREVLGIALAGYCSPLSRFGGSAKRVHDSARLPISFGNYAQPCRSRAENGSPDDPDGVRDACGRCRSASRKRCGVYNWTSPVCPSSLCPSFIHRDICPRNFMVDAQGDNLRLIDFGLTVPATPPFMQSGNRTGNPNYMAPELVKRQPT
ncbi:MAG: protein kinase domain-containing protein, partial [Pirellulales bacterium]